MIPGFIYAISSGNKVKIGWSRNPRLRLVNLSCGNPNRCKLLGRLPGSLADEAAIHSNLVSWHIRGEWFQRKGGVRDFLSTLIVEQPLEQKRMAERIVRRARRSVSGLGPKYVPALQRAAIFAGSDKVLAEMLGRHPATVCRWLQGAVKKLPSDVPFLVEKLTRRKIKAKEFVA